MAVSLTQRKRGEKGAPGWVVKFLESHIHFANGERVLHFWKEVNRDLFHSLPVVEQLIEPLVRFLPSLVEVDRSERINKCAPFFIEVAHDSLGFLLVCC